MTDCDHCTTHHHACDCREYEHALQVECLESALATHVDRICALTAKCDELQSIIAGQRDTMGALKRKLAVAEMERDALRARIDGAPVVFLDYSITGGWWVDARRTRLPQAWVGKRVRLVVEPDNG